MNHVQRQIADEGEVELFLAELHEKYHYDFRGYSKPSVRRRLLFACDRFGCRNLSELRRKVDGDSGRFRELLGSLTVQVSQMFRDPPYFLALRQQVLPYLRTYPSLKVWIAGCSTGEELYSLAILFREEGLESRTIFYATDINAEALSRAEAGIYSLERLASFTEAHRLSGARCSLSQYYNAAYGAAIFDKSLRQRTVFSEHSLVSDSVFAEVHLVSCRNVLIYFERPLQSRAVGLFRDSLVHNGFLGLGSKESLRFNAHADGFSEWLPKERIYRCKSRISHNTVFP